MIFSLFNSNRNTPLFLMGLSIQLSLIVISTSSYAHLEHPLIDSLKNDPIATCDSLLERAKADPNFAFPEQAPVIQEMKDHLETELRNRFPLSQSEELFRQNFIAELNAIVTQGYPAQSIFKASEKFVAMLDALDDRYRGGNNNGKATGNILRAINVKNIPLENLSALSETESSHFQELGYAKYVQNQLPFVLFISTFKAVDAEFLVKTVLSRCQIVGMIPDYLLSDNIMMSPLFFFHHDLYHAVPLENALNSQGFFESEKNIRMDVFPFLKQLSSSDPNLYQAVVHILFMGLHEDKQSLRGLLLGNKRFTVLNSYKYKLKNQLEKYQIDPNSPWIQKLDEAVYWLFGVYSAVGTIQPEVYSNSFLTPENQNLIELARTIEPFWQRVALRVGYPINKSIDPQDALGFCYEYHQHPRFKQALDWVKTHPIDPEQVPDEELFETLDTGKSRFLSNESKFIFAQKISPHFHSIIQQAFGQSSDIDIPALKRMFQNDTLKWISYIESNESRGWLTQFLSAYRTQKMN